MKIHQDPIYQGIYRTYDDQGNLDTEGHLEVHDLETSEGAQLPLTYVIDRVHRQTETKAA